MSCRVTRAPHRTARRHTEALAHQRRSRPFTIAPVLAPPPCNRGAVQATRVPHGQPLSHQLQAVVCAALRHGRARRRPCPRRAVSSATSPRYVLAQPRPDGGSTTATAGRRASRYGLAVTVLPLPRARKHAHAQVALCRQPRSRPLWGCCKSRRSRTSGRSRTTTSLSLS